MTDQFVIRFRSTLLDHGATDPGLSIKVDDVARFMRLALTGELFYYYFHFLLLA